MLIYMGIVVCHMRGKHLNSMHTHTRYAIHIEIDIHTVYRLKSMKRKQNRERERERQTERNTNIEQKTENRTESNRIERKPSKK